MWDLYCRIGTIGLAMAGRALTVWGVTSRESIAVRARERRPERGRELGVSSAGDVGQAVEELRDRSGNPDIVVVRPAAGRLSNKAIRRLGGSAPSRIVYVSCNRRRSDGNVKCWGADWGYELKRDASGGHVPAHTHVESVSLLERS